MLARSALPETIQRAARFGARGRADYDTNFPNRWNWPPQRDNRHNVFDCLLKALAARGLSRGAQAASESRSSLRRHSHLSQFRIDLGTIGVVVQRRRYDIGSRWWGF